MLRVLDQVAVKQGPGPRAGAIAPQQKVATFATTRALLGSQPKAEPQKRRPRLFTVGIAPPGLEPGLS
jgi:hypothetical protein